MRPSLRAVYLDCSAEAASPKSYGARRPRPLSREAVPSAIISAYLAWLRFSRRRTYALTGW